MDTNTKGNSHWFYFKVSNFKPGRTYTFAILNMTRDLVRFFSQGMQVITCMQSDNGAQTEWTRDTVFLEFEKSNGILKKNNLCYSTLKFKYQCPEDFSGAK